MDHCKNWNSGICQVLSYGSHYSSHIKRLHRFAHKGETSASKYFEMATKVCVTHGIRVPFEEVFPGGNSMGVDVVHGTDVFFEAAAGAATIPLVWGQGRGSYKKKVPKTVTPYERDGVHELVEAIGKAYQRTKTRGSEDHINNYMSLSCYRNSTLSMVEFLQKNDKEFQPGSWFVESKYFDAKNKYHLQ